jgi:hypothetical protein
MNATNATITLTKATLFSYISEEVYTSGVFESRYNSHYDNTEKYIRLNLPNLPKITKWVEDWVSVFNDTSENAGFVLHSYEDEGEGYIIEKIEPGDIAYPQAGDAYVDSIELTTKQYKDCPTMLKEEIDADVDTESGDEEDDEEDDEEEEDDWMKIYSEKDVDGELEELKPYKGFRYYQCWGGGPSGGFITNNKIKFHNILIRSNI